MTSTSPLQNPSANIWCNRIEETNLNHASSSSNRIGDDGCEALVLAFSSLKLLTTLNMKWVLCYLLSRGFKIWCSSLAKIILTYLDLSCHDRNIEYMCSNDFFVLTTARTSDTNVLHGTSVSVESLKSVCQEQWYYREGLQCYTCLSSRFEKSHNFRLEVNFSCALNLCALTLDICFLKYCIHFVLWCEHSLVNEFNEPVCYACYETSSIQQQKYSRLQWSVFSAACC